MRRDCDNNSYRELNKGIGHTTPISPDLNEDATPLGKFLGDFGLEDIIFIFLCQTSGALAHILVIS